MKVIKVRHYKVGYEIRTERLTEDESGVPGGMVMKKAYTPDGHYIGKSRWAYRLIVKRGIKPERREPADRICSIGFCAREQKWYGWSHRAIFGFGVGDVVKEGDCTASSGWTEEYLSEHPEEDLSLPVGFEAIALDDARRMAVAFADSVS